jgi:hypothetical protein
VDLSEGRVGTAWEPSKPEGKNVSSPLKCSVSHYLPPFSLLSLSLYRPIVARQRLGKHVPGVLCCPCRIKGKQAISSAEDFLFLILSCR